MKLPSEVAGRDPREMRDLFKTFVEEPHSDDWRLASPQRTMDASYVSSKLGVGTARATEIIAALVKEGWLKERLVPSTQEWP